MNKQITGVEWPFHNAYVINLDSRPDRWAQVCTSLEAVGGQASRISAVYWRDLSADEPSQALREFLLRVDGDSPKFETKLMATWACMRSHLAVIGEAKKKNYPEVLILEDDCELESYSRVVLSRVREQLSDLDWDMLYLGGTLKKRGRKQRVSSNLRSVSRVRLAHAYIVRASLYDRIIAEAPRSGLPIDWYYSEVLLPEVKGFIVKPMLAYPRAMTMSDIEQIVVKPKVRTRKMFRRFFSRVLYGFFLGRNG